MGAKRDYKHEYETYQKRLSSYRAGLNRKNRSAGTYGNGDGKDMSHKEEGVVPENESINRGRKEKSRRKGSKRKPFRLWNRRRKSSDQ